MRPTDAEELEPLWKELFPAEQADYPLLIEHVITEHDGADVQLRA